ncbi:cell division protein FtsZ [Marinilabiliaceae bacterium JC040]|jgi:cell division protein FtsZ|nr:cell division protein FtsZ [Marinilabiliaceae bacterium JC040]
MDNKEAPAIIKVIGLGGCGTNAVNYLQKKNIADVDLIVCDTDKQSLRRCKNVENVVPIGNEGLGTGNNPEKGAAAVQENIHCIETILKNNTKLIFITAGMGGGTGTGSAPIVAAKAKELGILTVAIVTLPFLFEGRQRLERALEGIDKLFENVDALLIINNHKIREIYGGNIKFSEAYEKADSVLTNAAASMAEIITKIQSHNVDFNDVVSIVKDAGLAVMGSGEGEGSNKCLVALEQALISPLLNKNNVEGASKILVTILHGESEPTAREIKEMYIALEKKVGSRPDVLPGYGHDPSLGDKVRVIIIATRFEKNILPTKDTIKEEINVNVPFDIVDPSNVEQVYKNENEPEDNFQLDDNPTVEPYVNIGNTGSTINENVHHNIAQSIDKESKWLESKVGRFFTSKDKKM